MPQIGPAEILVILLVGLLVFGPKRLPEIGRQVGKGMRELRKFQDTVRGELDGVLNLTDDEPSALPQSSSGPETLPAPAKSDESVESPSVTSDAFHAAPERPGARAPSRFRAPGTPPRA
jgi:sec-independent protein translocase protein TatA